VNETQADRHDSLPTRDRLEAMMINSYYPIYQAERGKTAAEIRAADAQSGGLAAGLGQLGSALAAPARTVRRSLRRPRAAGPAAPDAG
jgi:hypothetical protein